MNAVHIVHRQRWLLLLVVGLALASSGAESAPVPAGMEEQPCANLFGQLEGENMLIELNGTRVAIYTPAVPNGPYDMTSALVIQWTKVTEHYRMVRICSPLTDEEIFVQQLSNCHCTMAPIDTLTPDTYIHTLGWNVTITSCPAPQLSFVASGSLTISNDTFYEELGPTMPYSSAEYFNYTTAAGGLKLAYELHEWTWANETLLTPEKMDNTYLAIGLEFGYLTDGALAVEFEQFPNDFTVASYVGSGVKIKAKMDLGFVLEDQAAISSTITGGLNVTMDHGTTDDGFILPVPFPFCEPTAFDVWPFPFLRHWNHVYYDPSLTVVFGTVSETPSKSTLSPKAKKQEKTLKWIAIPITLVVALLVVGFILLVIFYKPLKAKVMPYNREHVAQKRAVQNLPPPEKAPKGWQTASKPVVSDD